MVADTPITVTFKKRVNGTGANDSLGKFALLQSSGPGGCETFVISGLAAVVLARDVQNHWPSEFGLANGLQGDFESVESHTLPQSDQFDTATRGPRMSGSTGNRIWKYQVPVSEAFTLRLPESAAIIRMDAEDGFIWLWAQVDTSAPDEDRHFRAFKAGGEMPDDMGLYRYVGQAAIFIQAELMLYFYEDLSRA